MPTRDEVEAKERADRALRTGRPAEALGLYKSLLSRVAVFEPGLYESWLEGAMAAYRALGAKRAAGFILLALRRFAEVEAAFHPEQDPLPWALALGRQGRRKEAARCLERAGLLVLAARELEAADDYAGARVLWERLEREPVLRGRAYEGALVELMRARVESELGNTEAADTHHAIGRLEALADEYESRGQRERAFDCYLLLLRLGQGPNTAFENLAEGYINAIRILIADGQRDFALQYLDDFMAAAADRTEFHAAAAVALDAAEYCRRHGLSFETQFLKRAVDFWMAAATQSQAQGQTPELAENALSAALDAATSLGDLQLLARVYQALAALPLEPGRIERYVTLADRYARSAAPTTATMGESALPQAYKSKGAYQDIAWQDLIEWELAGNAEAALTLIVVERTDHVRFARAALVALLVAVDNPHWPQDATAARAVAQGLGDVEVYEVLSPLEKLATHAAPDVRAAVMSAAGKVLCKRSFTTIRHGLDDSDERVRAEARRALRGLHFRDGLETLVRIFRESRDVAVREAALAAIADVPILEAAFVLLDVIREDDGALRALAVERLCTFPSMGLLPHVRAAMETATGAAKQSLQAVLGALQAYRP
ncbi:MAG: HEAT repeat domain-containing protein [Deltaproteobacteria bacterium]|nr:HEAT repeat domain-containing protein [Deltaproteobacteria bacterium]